MDKALIEVEVKFRGKSVAVDNLLAELLLTSAGGFPAIFPVVNLYLDGRDPLPDDLLLFHSAQDLVRREILTDVEVQEIEGFYKRFAIGVLREDVDEAIQALDPALLVIAQKVRVIIEETENTWRAYFGLRNNQQLFEGEFNSDFDFSILPSI